MSFRSRSSVATNGEDPVILPHTTISSLPDDLVLSCLARVSRLYYPTLSLVSKKFRLLLASPELYKIRSLLALTQSCLYVCLRFHRDSDPRWFTLCKKPNGTRYVLAPIPIHNPPQALWDRLVSVDYNIYAIGGPMKNKPSSKVSILDCRSHTWHKGPSMQVKRSFPGINVIDGKIYVEGGGSNDSNSPNWFEVFDPKTQIWEPVLSPPAIRNHIWTKLKGLVGLPDFAEFGSVKLADYGGKLVILWDKDLPCKEEKVIWCAEISIERRRRGKEDEEIWGNVDWFDRVLTVPASYDLLNVISTTL